MNHLLIETFSCSLFHWCIEIISCILRVVRVLPTFDLELMRRPILKWEICLRCCFLTFRSSHWGIRFAVGLVKMEFRLGSVHKSMYLISIKRTRFPWQLCFTMGHHRSLNEQSTYPHPVYSQSETSEPEVDACHRPCHQLPVGNRLSDLRGDLRSIQCLGSAVVKDVINNTLIEAQPLQLQIPLTPWAPLDEKLSPQEAMPHRTPGVFDSFQSYR